MIEVYKIDSNNVYVDVYKINKEKNTYYDGEKWIPIDFTYIEVQPPYAKVVKWLNESWVIVEEYPIEPIQPQELTELEQFKLEQAQADAELFEMMLMLTGGGF